MSTDSAAITHTADIGKRYRVTFTVGVKHFVAEWKPEVPTHLTKKEARAYRAARDAVIAEASERFGVRMAVIDV